MGVMFLFFFSILFPFGLKFLQVNVEILETLTRLRYLLMCHKRDTMLTFVKNLNRFVFLLFSLITTLKY